MSPRSELRASTSGSQAATPDGVQRSSEAPAPRLACSEKASGRLPEERERGPSSLCVAGCFVAVAGAVAFVACGVWQAGAIISRAREVAHDVVVAHAAAPTPPNPPPQPPAPEAVPRARQTPENGAAASADPVLTAAGNLSKAAASNRFEAQAEASERVVAVGFDAALDVTAGALTLGQPPPPDYPRVGCKDIFVYIVTIAEAAPRRSAASIGVGKKGPARFRRPGERIGDWTVLAITDDWSGLEPDVWLEKDGTACRAELAGNPSRIHQTPKPRPKARRKARRRRR